MTEVDNDDSEAGFILGAPWFRSLIVTLDYQTDSIQLYAGSDTVYNDTTAIT